MLVPVMLKAVMVASRDVFDFLYVLQRDWLRMSDATIRDDVCGMSDVSMEWSGNDCRAGAAVTSSGCS